MWCCSISPDLSCKSGGVRAVYRNIQFHSPPTNGPACNPLPRRPNYFFQLAFWHSSGCTSETYRNPAPSLSLKVSPPPGTRSRRTGVVP